jgi:hypothetical protein
MNTAATFRAIKQARSGSAQPRPRLIERRVEWRGRKMSRRVFILLVRAEAAAAAAQHMHAPAKPIPEAEPAPEAELAPEAEPAPWADLPMEATPEGEAETVGSTESAGQGQQGASFLQLEDLRARTAEKPCERAEARDEVRHLCFLLEADRSPAHTDTGMHVAVERLSGTPRPQAQASAAICKGTTSLLGG